MKQQRTAGKKNRTQLHFRILIAAGSVVVLVALAILVDSALYYNKVHGGVSVSGQSLGGLTRDEAMVRLTGLVREAEESEIVLVSGDRTWSVMPTDVGTTMDVAGAVSAAMAVSRESNLVVDLGRRLKLYFSDTDIALSGTVDDAMMDEILQGVAQELDVPPVNAGLAIEDGKIRVIASQKGRVVDRDALRQDLEALLITLHATELTVPIVVEEPAVKAEDNQEALDQAETMIISSLTLKDGQKSWRLTPEQIVAYMDFTAEDQNGVSTLVPYISAKKMGAFFDGIADQVATKPVDASFDSDGTRAWVVPGVPGKALDREKTGEALTAASLQTTGRVAVVAVTTAEPKLTTEEAEAMGIKDRLSSYTTEWVGSSNRRVNVKITVEYASDVMLAPGEEYDFDKQIGRRTAERGYLTAPGIVGPGKLEDVYGGGICQVSTTLFNAVFFAGLKVTERKNHSIYIDHYPKGRDATVSANGPNMRFKNDTKHYIWIRGTSDGITSTFNIYGSSESRTVSYTTSDFYNVVARKDVTVVNPSLGPGTSVVVLPGQSGKQVKVVRTVKAQDGSVIHKDTFVSTWQMFPRTIEVGPTTTTTLPSATTTTKGPSGTTSTSGPLTTSF
ncbi:MAG: VanW family protein [bacterium]